jgi:hypothetical protein
MTNFFSINPGYWAALAPVGTTTNILPPFYVNPVGPIFLSAINNGFDFNGLGTNLVGGIIGLHQMSGAPWGLQTEDPLLTLGGLSTYQYITDFGGFNLAMQYGASTNASFVIVGTNGVPVAALSYYPQAGWIIQPGLLGKNSSFDTSGSLNIYSNLTLSAKVTMCVVGTDLCWTIIGSNVTNKFAHQ